jgi:hypothetical protein
MICTTLGTQFWRFTMCMSGNKYEIKTSQTTENRNSIKYTLFTFSTRMAIRSDFICRRSLACTPGNVCIIAWSFSSRALLPWSEHPSPRTLPTLRVVGRHLRKSSAQDYRESLKCWPLDYQIEWCTYWHVVTFIQPLNASRSSEKIKRLICFGIGTLYNGIDVSTYS